MSLRSSLMSTCNHYSMKMCYIKVQSAWNKTDKKGILMKNLFVTAVIILGSLSTARAASKGQIIAALNAVQYPNIISVTEPAQQPRCFGCRVLKIDGTTPIGSASALVQVTQTGPSTFTTAILSQTK